uniref:Reverse transcriptase domain-containing protein n=1 Tax=Tanacetum cinerariifolium TaxID=118510 RepID=A0A699GVZ8_TANCI|nr:reverse transcriptase domain-containing protein [Tanacetum cinerariifolium]
MRPKSLHDNKPRLFNFRDTLRGELQATRGLFRIGRDVKRELLASKPTTLGDVFSLARITDVRLDDQVAPMTASELETKVLVDGKQDEAKVVKVVGVTDEQNSDEPNVLEGNGVIGVGRFNDKHIKKKKMEAAIQRRLWDSGIKNAFQDNTLRTRNCSIANRVSSSNFNWRNVLRRNPRGGVESSQFEALKLAIGNVVLTHQPDSWQWSPNVAVGYSVSSARALVDDNLLDLDVPFCDNISDWYEWLNDVRVTAKSRLILEGVWGTLMWAIWNFRNQLIFSSPPPRKSNLWDFIVSQSFLWITSRNPNCKISWIEVKALPTNDARIFVKFLKSLFARFGTPRAIISDRGTHFYNDQFANVMRKYGVTNRLLIAYHPQTSRQVEVSNRGSKRILKRTVGENHASWSDKVDGALWAFRDHRKVQLNELDELQDQAYENSLIYKEKTKKIHDFKIKNHVFNVGDQDCPDFEASRAHDFVHHPLEHSILSKWKSNIPDLIDLTFYLLA